MMTRENFVQMLADTLEDFEADYGGDAGFEMFLRWLREKKFEMFLRWLREKKLDKKR